MAKIEFTQEGIKVTPSQGRQVISKFKDYETKLFIVEECYEDSNVSSDIFLTTIDLELQRIIEPEARSIAYGQMLEHSDPRYTSTVNRIINYKTGYEYLEGKVFEDGKEIFCRRYDAYSENPTQSNFDYFLNYIKENKKAVEKSENEYKLLTYEERVKYWSGTLHREMRWQAESGLDPYAIYTSEWYKRIKTIEPEIDSIMDKIFSSQWNTTGGEWSKEEFLKRIKE